MLNFDYLILKSFLEENIEFLQGARLQKIQQPTRQELLFSMRNQVPNVMLNSFQHRKNERPCGPETSAGLHSESRKFYININPKFFHLCFASEENYQKRFPEKQKASLPSNNQNKTKNIFTPPPMFCMLLRKYLEGSRISKVVQPDEERILELYFETYNEIGEKIYLCLAIELMGKHSNVVLYNYDTNVIIGCAHNVGSDKSREREVIGGLPYAYPLKHSKQNFSGLSSLYTPHPIPLPQGARGTYGNYLSVNDFIDNYFANLQEQEKIKNIKSRLLTVTKTKLRKAKIKLEKIQNQSASSEKADAYRKKGDLIMANLYNEKDFIKEIEVMDWETNSPFKIKLDETKSLKDNANQYYKLYNKAKTANEKTGEMLENLKQEIEYLEQVLYSIENAESVDDLSEIEEEEKREKGKGKRNEFAKQNLQPFTFHFSPFTLYVGKNNKQNDYIVSKLARDNDMWFHVHNCAGSHVLLRVEAGQQVTDEIIFECAKLAKQYSSAKDSSKVGVIYTKAKNLKKPTGANLGYVTYKGEKEIIVD